MSEKKLSLPLLANQLQQLQDLTLLLDKEHDVLQHHDPEALNLLTVEKNKLLLSIEQVDQQLAKDAEFLSHKKQGLCDELLTEIEKQLAQCKEKNFINGQIIQHSQFAVERMKTTLLESNSKTSVTYDNKGKKSGGLSSIGVKA